MIPISKARTESGETKNYFRSPKFRIDYKSPGKVVLSIFNPSLANKVNNVVGRYPDYRIKQGEEFMAPLNMVELAALAGTLGLGSDLLKRIENDVKNGSHL